MPLFSRANTKDHLSGLSREARVVLMSSRREAVKAWGRIGTVRPARPDLAISSIRPTTILLSVGVSELSFPTNESVRSTPLNSPPSRSTLFQILFESPHSSMPNIGQRVPDLLLDSWLLQSAKGLIAQRASRPLFFCSLSTGPIFVFSDRVLGAVGCRHPVSVYHLQRDRQLANLSAKIVVFFQAARVSAFTALCPGYPLRCITRTRPLAPHTPKYRASG